jgi:hypothetical protein
MYAMCQTLSSIAKGIMSDIQVVKLLINQFSQIIYCFYFVYA